MTSPPLPASSRQTGFRQNNDPRDARFPLSALMGAAKGKTRKMTSRFYKLGPIMDQGTTSSCVGHGCKLLLTSEPYAQADPVSPFTIYREARVIDEFPDDATEGTSVRAGLKVLQQRGLIQNYYWATDIEQVVDYLLRISPLIVGTEWFEGMAELDHDGIATPQGRSMGGHCYFAHGVDVKAGTIGFANSWGVQFGFMGLFSLRMADFAKLLYKGGCAAAVREK